MGGKYEDNHTGSAIRYKKYTASGLSADVDLSEDFPGRDANRGRGDLPRKIIWTGGNIVVKDKFGNSETLTSAMSPLEIRPLTLVDTGTTATEIVVIW